jgi:quinol monooxygenase YgiN
MIVISGTLTYVPESEDLVRAACIAVAEETRREEGCISYEFFADLTGPGRVHVFEEWESDEALAAHGASAHIAAFRDALRGAGTTGRTLTRYVVEESGPFG